MTHQYAVESPKRSVWSTSILGVVMILAGIFVLGDVALATIISAKLIGVAAIAVGMFEIVYAIWAGGWRGFLWHTALGILYIVFGCALISQPAFGSLILTWFVGLALLVSGIVRMFLAMRQPSHNKWMIFLPGLYGFVAGLLILIGWPSTGLWVIGTLLGIDLVLHGLGWILVAWKPVKPALRTPV